MLLACVSSLCANSYCITVILSFFAIRYDTRCYFNVRSKADMSQLNLPYGSKN